MTTEADVESIRLLQCFECKTMEELPDYQGNANFDSVLQAVDEKHGGMTQQPHARTLHRVAKRIWDDRRARRSIVEGMWKDTTGFKPSYYDVRNTLLEDAVKCFKVHNRQIPCIDYQDSSKRLGNPAAQERARLARELRNDDLKLSTVRVYLCNFCPVQTAVDSKKFEARAARGLE